MNEDIHLITFMCACFCLVIIVLHLSRQRQIFFRSLRLCCRGYDDSDNTPSPSSMNPRFGGISIPQRTTPARRLSRVTDKETRRYFILTNMIHKTVHLLTRPNSEQKNQRSHSSIQTGQKDDIYIDSSDDSSSCEYDSESADDSQKQCIICLGKYVSQDSICWSKNDSCSHVYHSACILEWLLEHNDCPQCREEYVIIGNASEGLLDGAFDEEASAFVGKLAA